MFSRLRRNVVGKSASPISRGGIATPEPGYVPSRGSLLVEYEPIVSVRTGALAGAEAIARWSADHGASGNHPITPTPDFEAILEAGCADLAQWQYCTPDNVALSIDISPDQILEDSFGSIIRQCIQRHALRPARIKLEMREPRDRDITGDLIERLSDLRRMGLSIVLDDFGMEHSTLTSLIALPVSGLKFGRRFTTGLPHDRTSTGILTSVVSLARDLGISVAIDGVQTDSQLAWLGQFGQLDVQGTVISGPVSGEAFLYRLLRSPGNAVPAKERVNPQFR